MNHPSRLDTWRLKAREERKTYPWPGSWVHQAHGIYRRRGAVVRDLLQQSHTVERLAASWSDKSDDELREIVNGHRAALMKSPVPSDALNESLAAVAIASRRILGLTPYPVQLAGALGLFQDLLAEMATGEGKSLTIALAATLQAGTRLPTHVITANDYLAERDAAELAEFYAFFGLKAAAVTGEMGPPERRAGYAADITYTTPKNIVADFLRDRLQLGLPLHAGRRRLRRLGGVPVDDRGVVMRGLHFGIIDEADSVLIDEAVTPLLISSKALARDLENAVTFARQACRELVPGVDYIVNPKFRELDISSEALDRIAARAEALPPAWQGRDRVEELLRTAISAREFYHRDIHYVIDEGKIQIVDDFTGRVLPDRTWQEGLHQAVEAKEEVEISPPHETRSSLSFQRYFRCYPRLSGLSGTAAEAKREFWAIYHLPVIRIPTHRPIRRVLQPTLICRDLPSKWESVIREIQAIHECRRPILVGTRSIGDSEELSERLTREGLPHRVLNAIRHREEAEIIARAGLPGSITIATNMAGRGTDIKLGPGVADLGGLHVIATEVHESGRIDRQLIGRAGRQGDPGSARFIISAEDAILKRFLPSRIRLTLASLIESQDQGRSGFLLRTAFRFAQSSSEKMAFRTRRQVLKQDTNLDEQLSFSGKGTSL